MNSQIINEEISRIKSVMGLLNETLEPASPYDKTSKAYNTIKIGYLGPGTNVSNLVKGFQMIKSVADYQQVESEEKKYGGYGSIVAMLNGELESDDLATAQQIQAALKAAGVNLTFQTDQNQETGVTGEKYGKAELKLKEKSFKIGSVGAPAASPAGQPGAQATNGWWDKYPALYAYMKENTGKVHYPPAANAQNGAIAIEKDGGVAHDFFPDGRWYQYGTVQEGLAAVVKPQYEGKWSDKNGVLYITASDGEVWTSKTRDWAKPQARAQYTKNNGFPLMYMQMTAPAPDGLIGKMQAALGMKGDGYFGPITEKAVINANNQYKRETGVTEDMYNKIIEGYRYSASKTQPAAAPQPAPPSEADLQANPSTLNPY